MNREIKFRGFSKRFIPNEWFYGDLVNYRGEKYILPKDENVWDIIGDGVAVHSESVGQFTGLYDKHGKEIYEGDILDTSDGYGVVKWSSYDGGWDIEFSDEGVIGISEIIRDLIVAGNIHQTPELWK